LKKFIELTSFGKQFKQLQEFLCMFNYEVNNIHKMIDIKSKFPTLMALIPEIQMTPIGKHNPEVKLLLRLN